VDFSLNPEQLAFQEAVNGFAERALASGALERAHDSFYPHAIARACVDQGLFGINVPESDGGQGGSLLDAIIAIQSVASVCPRSADIIQVGNFGPIRVLSEYANADQKERYLKPLLRGEKIISVCMTEPHAGSAVTDLRSTATAEGDNYRINGSKVFSTHGPYADLLLVYVRFGPGVDGIGSVLIEREFEGVKIGKTSRFLNGDDWSEIYFDNVEIPAANVLLGTGGFKKQISGFNVERLGNSARALALGRFAFDAAVKYALERRQFDQRICDFQGIQWKFSDMYLQLESAQLLLYRAASELSNGLPDAHQTALAKLACNQAGFNATHESMQVMGALGYSEETLVEYCFRRTRGWMIAGGSVEILKNRVAEGVFGERFSQRPASS